MDEEGLDQENTNNSLEDSVFQAEVLYTYVANEDDELTVNNGDYVTVIDMKDPDWWQCEYNEEIGMLPANYLRILDPNEIDNEENNNGGNRDNEGNRENGSDDGRPSDDKNNNIIASPKPYPISQSDLPAGWKMFVEKESGDIYYYNEITGETTWDPPDKPTFDEAFPISSATEDLQQLNIMKQQASSKINALRGAVNSVRSSSLSPPSSLPSLPSSTSVKKLQNNNSSNRIESKTINDMSIDEINRIIDERILKEVKKREDHILQKVQTMLSSQPSKLRSASDSAGTPMKQKKIDLNSSKLPIISRSAESKFKTPPLTTEDSTIRPKSGPGGGGSSSVAFHNSPTKPIDFQQKKFAALRSPKVKSNESLSIENENDDEDDTSLISKVISNDDNMLHDDTSVGKSSLNDNDTPYGSLSLAYVHGYDGDFTRNGGTKASGKNIFWLSEEMIIYPAASLVILLNIKSGQQLFYKSHTEEVSALTVHSNLHLIASGQMGKDSRILIWDSRLLLQQHENNQNQNLQSPKGHQKYSPRYDPPIDPSMHYHREVMLQGKTRGVMHLNFSPDGILLVALGLEESKPIFIYDWMKNECLATMKLGHIDIYQIGFNPHLYVPPVRSHNLESLLGNGGDEIPPIPRINPSKIPLEDNICCYSLITTMTRGVKFWTLRHVKERNDVVALASNGSQFKGRKIAIPKHKQSWSWKYVLEGNLGVFPKKNNHTPPDMTCYSILPEETETGKLPKSKILTGGSNGSVYIWQQLEAGVEDTSREDYVPQFWLPRGRLLCVITGVHEGPLLDMDIYLTPSHVNQQLKYLVSTCGKDGILNIWELDGKNTTTSDVLPMDHVTATNISSHSPVMGLPRSVQWCLDGHHMIVGTTGNNLCIVRNHGHGTSNHSTPVATAIHSSTDQHSSSTQFTDLRLDVVISSHVGRINRVVPHPSQNIFATVGTDKSIRLWSAKWCKQVASTRAASNPTSVAFIPDGSGVAIGTEVGEVLILTCTYLQKILETGEEPKLHRKRVKWDLLGRKIIGTKSKGKEPTSAAAAAAAGGGGGGGAGGGGGKQKNLQSSELTEMKYSPDGEYLAVASRDKCIHLLAAKNGYKKIGICKGHSGVITRIDWTSDSAYLQSSDGSRESLMWEVPSGKQWSGNAKDFLWSSWSNPIGSFVRGILNGPNGPIDLNGNGNGNLNSAPSAADLSMINGIYRSNDQRSLVVASGGNSFNSVPLKLFRFPCHKNSKSKEYYGHSSAIEDVCYLMNDQDLCSIGGSDSCIFCWKHTIS